MFGLKKSSLYIISILIFLSGIAFFGYSVKKNYSGLGNTLRKFEFPGNAGFTLEENGSYSIYHEYITRIDGKRVDNSELNINSIKVLLYKLPENILVRLETPESYKKYSYLGRDGVKMFQFKNDGKNQYRLKSGLKDLKEPERYVLTVEKGFEITRHKGILVSQAVLLFPILISIFIFIRTYLQQE